MFHLMKGVVVLVVTLSVFVIGFVALDEPMQLIFGALSDVYPEEYDNHDDVTDFQDNLIYFFYAAIALGVILTFVWFTVWSQKDEFERFRRRNQDDYEEY